MTNISTLTWSRHCLEERENRMMDILMNDGFGEVIAEFPAYNEAKYCITNTACVLVVSPDGLVITTYLLTYKMASALFKDHIPPQLYQRIHKNYKHCNTIRKGSKKG